MNSQRDGLARSVQVRLALSDTFVRDPSKQLQWKAFRDRNHADAPSLEQVIPDIRIVASKLFDRMLHGVE